MSIDRRLDDDYINTMALAEMSLERLSDRCLGRRERRARGWRHTLFAAAISLGAFALVGALVSGLLR